jgi:hypothetical protein
MLGNREVKKPKQYSNIFVEKLVNYIYFIFVCIPVFLFVYLSIEIGFLILDTIKFLKKTIKYAKAKFVPKPFKSLS